jgi:hypothetical protein
MSETMKKDIIGEVEGLLKKLDLEDSSYEKKSNILSRLIVRLLKPFSIFGLVNILISSDMVFKTSTFLEKKE